MTRNKPIRLKATTISPGPSTAHAASPGRRAGRVRKALRGVGWLFGGPADWFGGRRVMGGASLVRQLIMQLRSGQPRDARFRTEEGGRYDVRASAFLYGMSEGKFEARLAARRRQTARIAYAMFVMGWLFLGAWVWQAVSSPLTAARLASAVDFLPFCALFFLLAFYNALLNYQVRMGRLATWREYLTTNDRFWPS